MDLILSYNGKFYSNIRGKAEGTSYNIIYQDDSERDFQPDIENLLSDFEKSLSVYDETSIISCVNRNEDIEVDNYFSTVFNRAKEISKLTDGTFDISAEPLFRIWGFSFKERAPINTDELIDVQQYIGMDKIRMENKRIIKSHPNIVLNANAIAKGYSADIVADFIEERGVSNYLIEIGGEIRVSGLNTSGEAWRIGVDKPSDNNLIPGQDLQLILQISDRGIATSGNYRQFYIENGQKIPHTIDPRTGYPVKHNLLSTTVVACDALTADAFATAFLVVGIDVAKQWVDTFPFLDALFIYDEDGKYKVHYTTGMEKYIL
ncbi:FAD:protein FMN transferase [Dysgonomonas sp. ZJ709]|uniref:FAD:protein FMN transferase n=1 Tax=Dysgonomonas sp. ZJ709 TaxID=2709797 RepID=UPI0013EA7C95|nr:FAD:protein FMN transferase [Dysgonomonas sp. ZJ709]